MHLCIRRATVISAAISTLFFASPTWAGIAAPDPGDPGTGARVTMSEVFDTSTRRGGYRIRNNSNLPGFGPEIRIFGVGVENPTTEQAFSFRSHWSGVALTESQWNGSAAAGDGYAVMRDTPGDTITLFHTDDLGSLKSLFGPDVERANFYWISSYIGVSDPTESFIDPGEASEIGDFIWSARGVASDMIILGQGQPGIAFRTFPAQPTAIPEPAGFALMGLGLGALVALRRRRRSS